jgi:two-component system phosphate regulon sensor histidine kinase PhoR
VEEVLHRRRLLTIEIELPRKQLVLSVIASRLPGEPAGGVVMVFHDMTELRRLENLRREFVSNVSHELKTPLASIQAYTDTLLEGALEDPANNRKFLERIEEQAGRLHMLILDVIKIAQVETGREVFEMSAIDIAEMVDECVQDHTALAESKRIQIEIEPPEGDARLHVRADAEGFRTILDNLLDNAIKYTLEDGTVTVSWHENEDRVYLKVADTGVGIPQEHLERIFERFYRVDKARSREMGGTGLGLSIVKHLTQVFGGGIKVESRQGEGSTFTVELPRT